jgi:RecB family exonuclease
MNELHAWLASQHPGLRTFKTFQLKLAEFAARHPEQRAMCRLLDAIVGRYVEEFDEAPLPSAVAERAYESLLRSVAELDGAAEPAQQLGALNRLATFSLTR